MEVCKTAGVGGVSVGTGNGGNGVNVGGPCMMNAFHFDNSDYSKDETCLSNVLEEIWTMEINESRPESIPLQQLRQ